MDINWRLYSYVRIAIAFMVGIYIADLFKIEFDYCIIYTLSFSIIVGLIVSQAVKSRIAKSVMMLFAILCLGVLRYESNDPLLTSIHFSKFNKMEHLKGIVVNYPKTRTRTKLVLKIIEACDQKDCIKTKGQLLVYFPKNDSVSLSLVPDQIVLIKNNIQPIYETANPLAFDFKSYLAYRKIGHQIFLKNSTEYTLLPLKKHWFNVVNSNHFRNKLINDLGSYFQDEDSKAVISAMILGYKNQLDQELYKQFTNSGAVHILAVSGLHVGIVCYLFMFFLDRIKIKSQWYKATKAVLLIAIVWSYAMLSGAAPAVIRASIMFSILLIGKYWFDHYKMLNVIAFSALLMLIYDPYLLFQASFQFSYLSLISIIVFQPKLAKLFSSDRVVLDKVLKLMSVATAAQIFVFPITIYYFHKFPTYFLLTGIVAVPMAVLILYSGIALLLMHYIFPFLALGFSHFINFILSVFLKTISCIDQLPLSSMNGLWISTLEMGFIYLGLIAFAFYVYQKKYVYLQWIGYAIILFLISFGYKNVKQSNQRELMVYSSPKGTLIDVFAGKKVYSIKSRRLSTDDLTYISSNYRDQHGTKQIVNLFNYLSYTSEIKVLDHSVKIEEVEIQIIDDKMGLVNSYADYYVLMNNSKMLPKEMTLKNGSATIVVDATISKDVVESWRAYCENNNLHFVSTRNKAFSLKIK